MRVIKKHIYKLFAVVQKCVSSIQMCYNSDYSHIQNNIFGSNWSIGLQTQSLAGSFVFLRKEIKYVNKIQLNT